MASSEILLNPRYTKFSLSKSVVIQFIFKTNRIGAMIWAYVFALTATSSIIGYEALYKTAAARTSLAASFGSNSGIAALLGVAYRLDTVGGFVAWRGLGIVILIAPIWAILASTKALRGEEDTGRWEMFLSGQTTARRAVTNTLIGLFAALTLIFVICTAVVFLVGQIHGVHFNYYESVVYGLAVISSPAEFLAVGALASQLAPIRRRASIIAALTFGIFFIIRAVGSADQPLSWMINVSPLGWVDKIKPLSLNQVIWLIPIFGFVIIVSGLAIYLAGKRDFGEGILADKDESRPKIKLLTTPLKFAVRMERNVVISWTIGVALVGFIYGYLTKVALSALTTSGGASKVIGKISDTGKTLGAESFLSVVFLLIMIVIFMEATNLVTSMRSDESQGYLDNILVRPISRLNWISGRLFILLISVVASGLIAAFFAWIGTALEHTGVPLGKVILSGINILPAIIFLIGMGILAFGFVPRLTSKVMYAVIAWSFILQIVGSVINLNHYILDTSLIYHVALAPGVNPNWYTDLVLLVLGLVMIIIGVYRFGRRDLENE